MRAIIKLGEDSPLSHLQLRVFADHYALDGAVVTTMNLGRIEEHMIIINGLAQVTLSPVQVSPLTSYVLFHCIIQVSYQSQTEMVLSPNIS